MMRPRTASPRNSSRSLESWPGFSAHHDRWTRAVASTSMSGSATPRRSARTSIAGTGSLAAGPSDAVEDVVNRVAHSLDVFEVFVLDAEPHRALAQLFLQRLGQLDQRQRVGFEVVGERLTFADGGGLDFEDVGQTV